MKVIRGCMRKLQGFESIHDPVFGRCDVDGLKYMEFLLNNREVQVPAFNAAAHKCEGVFETLNMITRMLLNKYVNQSTPQYA